jgi:hypothetical protein
MARPTSTWKSAERAIARWWPGAKRRGSDFRGEDTAGKTDIVCPGWAIEVKHFTSPIFSKIVAAVLQAETNKPKPDDIPVAVIHKAGTEYKDSLVVMHLEEFAKFFINNSPDQD